MSTFSEKLLKKNRHLNSNGLGMTAEVESSRRPGPSTFAMPVVLAVAAAILGSILPMSYSFILEYAVSLSIYAVATNLLLGFGGLVSFGQGVFYGLGAYTVALNWMHHGLSFWEAFALAPFVGAAASVLMGLVALRTRKLYFALLTLAFSQLAYVIVGVQYNFTSGANGIFGAMVPNWLVSPRNSFFFVLGVTVVSLLVMWKVTSSPFGLVLQASRDNRDRVEALGVNVFRHQLVAMAIAGFFCAVAGTLFVIYSQSTYPDLFLWTSSGIPVFMVVIGGMYKYMGPVIGAVVYEIAHHFLIGYTQDWQIVLGLVLVVIVLLRPDGLAGAFNGLIARRRGRVSLEGGES